MNKSRRCTRSGSANLSPLSLAVFGATATGALGQTIRFDSPVVYADAGRTNRLVAADLDRDGDVDVAGVTNSLTIALSHNDGAGHLQLQGSIPIEYQYLSNLHAADMDGDRDVDIIWFDRLPDYTYVLSVWYNSGDGITGEVVQTPIPTSPGESLITDVNGDGYNDIVYQSASRTISVMLNNRDRSFGRVDLYTYQSSEYHLSCMTAGDFDGDGDDDLAATFQYTYSGHYYSVKGTQVALLINNGAGAFQLRSETELPWQTSNLGADNMAKGDLDGDGDLDVIVGGGSPDHEFTNEFEFLRNDEGQSLSIAATHRASSGYYCTVATGDIDTDGRLDLIFVTSDVAGVYVVRNNGGFVFSGQSPFLTTVQGYGLGAADLNGDGQIDLLQGGSAGVATIANITTLRGPKYNHSALRRGRLATFVVTGATPGEEVRFLYSTAGAGNSLGYSVLGGITLDVLEPFAQFGIEPVDANGRAILRRVLPNNTPLGPITTQAVIRRGSGGRDSVKTPFRTAVISD